MSLSGDDHRQIGRSAPAAAVPFLAVKAGHSDEHHPIPEQIMLSARDQG
jgi:hypothetical protein